MLFADLAAASVAVAATAKRNEKVELLAEVLRRAGAGEVIAAVAFLTGSTPTGRLGVGWATLVAAADSTPAADVPSLTVSDVETALQRIARLSGDGSQRARRAELAVLLASATVDEQRLLRGIIAGELRQGALAGVVTAAVAKAAGVSVAAVQRGAMMAGDLGVAARVALVDGQQGLAAIAMEPLRPVQPMLASSAASVADAFAALAEGRAAQVDWKLDGVRVQVHRRGGVVRVFTRNLNDITARLPSVVDAVSDLPGGDLVLDGEALGVLDDGAPLMFQESMRTATVLEASFFDILCVDGRSVVDEPLAHRRELLHTIVPAHARLESMVTDDVAAAESFLQAAIAAGHEGVMVKDLAQPYTAGRRGVGWQKVKPVHTLDLVVLAVERGSGRRRGTLSNIHLGARDPECGFVMVGKTFKGMTDEMLRWQTSRFGELAIDEVPIGGRRALRLAPVQVVEVAVDGVQASTTYPGGVALRFARVRRYRDDKLASEADTIDEVRSLLPRAAR